MCSAKNRQSMSLIPKKKCFPAGLSAATENEFSKVRSWDQTRPSLVHTNQFRERYPLSLTRLFLAALESSWGSLCSSQCLWRSAGEKYCSALRLLLCAQDFPECPRLQNEASDSNAPRTLHPSESVSLLPMKCASLLLLIWKPLLDSWRAVAQSAGRCGVLWCVLTQKPKFNTWGMDGPWMDVVSSCCFHIMFFWFVLPKYLEFDNVRQVPPTSAMAMSEKEQLRLSWMETWPEVFKASPPNFVQFGSILSNLSPSSLYSQSYKRSWKLTWSSWSLAPSHYE